MNKNTFTSICTNNERMKKKKIEKPILCSCSFSPFRKMKKKKNGNKKDSN